MAKPILTSKVVGGRVIAGGYGARRAGSAYRRGVKDVERGIARLSEVLKRQAEILANKNRAAFFTFGHKLRGGTSWRPLKPSTLRTHRRMGWSGMPLLASGRLRNSIKGVVVGPTRKGRQLNFTVRVVAGAFYGRFHATGYINVLTGRRVPARPPVQFTRSDIAELEAAIAGAVTK